MEKEDIARRIRKYVKLNENENTDVKIYGKHLNLYYIITIKFT